eukprot:4699976-Amphidinium_carterae.1
MIYPFARGGCRNGISQAKGACLWETSLVRHPDDNEEEVERKRNERREARRLQKPCKDDARMQ